MEKQKMEELVKNMQEMFNKVKQDDGSDKYLFFSPKYNSKVKVADWFLPLEAEPKDNNPYSPPGGNYFLSTYKRLGTEAEVALESETHAMLCQVCNTQLPRSKHEPLVSSGSDSLLREEACSGSKTELQDEMDFTTTYNYDYRHPFPYRKIQVSKLQAKSKPRQFFGLTPEFIPSKICETKFLDDDFYSRKRLPNCCHPTR